MANLAQSINCLQSLFVAHEDKFIVTPNYHVFDMYMDHMGAEAVRTEFVAPRVSYTRNGQPRNIPGPRGLGVAQGQDADADRREPERGPAARDGNRHRRRPRHVRHGTHADDAEAGLAQHLRGTRRRAVAGRDTGDHRRAVRVDFPAGVGDEVEADDCLNAGTEVQRGCGYILPAC